MKVFRRILAGVVLAVVSLPVWAQDWPVHTDLFVNDYAGIIDDGAEQRIRGELKALKDQTGVEMTVLTLESRSGYFETKSIENFATKLFNAWGIGDKTKNDGILMLVIPQDRAVRIELGAGYDQGYDVTAQDIASGTIVPMVRAGKVSEAIEAGVGETDKRIARRFAEKLGAEPSANFTAPEKSDWFTGLAIAAFGLVAVFGRKIGSFFGSLRRCPQCGNRTLETRRQPGVGPDNLVMTITTCRSCGYRREDMSRPRNVRTSSERDKSFGGGRSSGGGATGRW